MASVAHTLFADDGAKSRRRKKRSDSRSSRQLDAVATSAINTSGQSSEASEWQEFTSPDGRTYYYNQVHRLP